MMKLLEEYFIDKYWYIFGTNENVLIKTFKKKDVIEKQIMKQVFLQ